MKKITMFAVAMLTSLVMFGAEKITTIPITGGFGVKLGETFSPQLEKKLKATKQKYDDDTIGYKIIPEKPLKNYKSYSVLLTKNRKVYKIQAMCISTDPDTAFSDAVYQFQKKYGQVSGLQNEVTFVDKNTPTRSIKIFKGDCYSAIIYQDTGVTASENSDI